ncbi:MAG: exodeoxyribonuclease VII large subunit [Candidatus Omnitrophota bacterium]|jgi:exodeoxyribonuclease VII large subunit
MENPKHIYNISELARDIKIILENTFGEIWVEGEVSNFSSHPSGHFYFTLKDDAAVLPAAMFSRANRELKFKIENGMKIVCFGKVSAYGPRGQYQIIVEKLEPKGIGSLQLALEQLKQKLEKEGLFSPEHKRPVPYLPSKIGIVTSLSGAAIKDILKVLDRRFSDAQIIINPAQVQGNTAKDEIAQAIKDLNTLNEDLPAGKRIEVMIVGRGGGSIEDLWAFNEEAVARAIYNSKIPVISAVGHERDWTIADLVADLRAPTPSVAAELVLPKKEDLREKVADLSQDALRALSDIYLNLGEALDNLRHRLAILSPVLLIQQHKTKIADLARQIYVRFGHFIKLRQAEFSGAAEKLSSLSPLNILGRGYSITFKMPEGAILKNKESIRPGDILKTKLHQGEILSKVMEAK